MGVHMSRPSTTPGRENPYISCPIGPLACEEDFQIGGRTMPVSTIHVNRNGRPVSGSKVMLSFATGGVSETVRTGSDGKAVVNHTATGTATVFIDGRNMGQMRAPGTQSF